MPDFAPSVSTSDFVRHFGAVEAMPLILLIARLNGFGHVEDKRRIMTAIRKIIDCTIEHSQYLYQLSAAFNLVIDEITCYAFFNSQL